MNLLESVKENWLTSLCWWAGFCIAFLVLTRLCPCNPGRNWWSDPRAALTDFIYWSLMPLVGLFGRIALLLVGVMILYGEGASPNFTARNWPLWVQCVIILLFQDALMYWIHRLFHTRLGWQFHAIHHSSETLDWTSASRFHPINAIAAFAFVDAMVLLMGFSPVALAALGPFTLIYSVMVHANLNWTFGPLRFVLASPVFHRWHHTTEEQGLDKNFASTFPFLDLLWGTFYMPAGVRPETYGANEPALPLGPFGQTLFPFRGAGRWTFRHPIFATAFVLSSTCLGYVCWQVINEPMELQPVAIQDADRSHQPPDFLPLNILQTPKTTSAVVVNAIASRAIYGLRDGSITIRDLTTSREMSFERHKSRVNSLASSPNGALAVSASSDGTAVVFNAETGTTLWRLSHNGASVMSAAVSDDGWVATGTYEGLLKLWDSRGELVKSRTLESVSINSIAISEGGRYAVVAQSSQVNTWDVANNSLTKHHGLSDLAYCVQISRDGRRVAAGEYNGQLHLWDRGKEGPRLVVKGHAGPIFSISISSDGESIVTGGDDQVVRVWNVTSGAIAKELQGHAGLVFSVSYDDRRQRILAAGKDKSLTHWDAPSGGIMPVAAIKP